LARFLIETGLSRYLDMRFDENGRLVGFGLDDRDLQAVIGQGTPFMTTGCAGPDGQVACNRPFGNCLPDVRQWNYPYPLNPEEIALVRKNILSIS
jgi:biotin synthase